MDQSNFDSLLRNLVTFGLVEERIQPDGRPGWQLTPATEKQLNVLRQWRPVSSDKVVHIGRRCAQCAQFHATWLRDGRFLCEECRTAEDHAVTDRRVGQAPPPGPVPGAALS